MHERTPKTNALRKQGFSSVTKFLIILAVLATGGILMSRFGALAGTITNISMRPVNLTTGLAAHWTFDGNLQNAADSSGNGNTGYFANFGATTTVPGKIGQALKFTGANPYIRIPPNASVELGTTMSIGFWIKRNPLLALSSYDSYIQKTDFSGPGWAIQGNDTTADMYIRVDTTAGAAQTPCFGMPNMLDGSWHHLVIVLDASQPTGTCRSYVDGVASVSGTFNSGTGFNNPANEFLMRGGGGSGGATVGGIDDVRLYNRLLSAKEAQQLYQLGGVGTKSDVTTAPPRLADSNSGLIGHWTFDGKNLLQNAADSSGQGNTGYLSGFTSTTTVPGKLGQALPFNGANGYVEVVDNATLEPDEFSASFWLKPDTFANNVTALSFIAKRTSTSDGYFIFYYRATNTLTFDWGGSSGGNRWDTTYNPPLGQWSHIVVTRDSTGRRAYVNGVLYNSTSNSGISANVPTTADLRIASDSAAAQFRLKGVMDDVRLYSRALSAAEAKQLYDMGATTKIGTTQAPPRLADPNSGLVGHWSFDGKNLLQNAADSSGQGNTGSLFNFTSTTTVPGRLGQALDFNGGTNFVQVPTNGTFDSSTGTWSFWFKPRNSGNNQGILSRADSGSSFNGITMFKTNLNGITGQLKTTASTVCNIASSATYTPTWHHAVLVWTQANAGLNLLYIDGVQVDSCTNSAAWAFNGTVVRIGKPVDSFWNAFNGAVDDVRIYNRQLSLAEVKQLYDMGR